MQQSTQEVTIKLEGRIAGPWVEELHRTWISLAPSLGSKPVCVDLCGVTFVDLAGKHLLGSIWNNGVRYLADTQMTKHLVEEIQQGL